MSFINRILSYILFLFILSCSPRESNLTPLKIVTSDNVTVSEFMVEIADTKETAYHGLMGRTSLDADSGMLFDVNIIPSDMDVAMWMKDTLVPLDMIFIDNNGIIFFIHQNAQPNDITPIYPPQRPRAVLEINAGQVAEYGIKVGDIVHNKMFGNQ